MYRMKKERSGEQSFKYLPILNDRLDFHDGQLSLLSGLHGTSVIMRNCVCVRTCLRLNDYEKERGKGRGVIKQGKGGGIVCGGVD